MVLHCRWWSGGITSSFRVPFLCLAERLEKFGHGLGSKIGFDAVQDPMKGTFEAVIIRKFGAHCDEPRNIRKLTGCEDRA